MLMSLSTCLIITQLLMLSKGAPKLGSVLFDPLTVESHHAIAKKINQNYPVKQSYRYPVAASRRNDNEQPEGAGKKPCHGYDFDELKCKLVNTRILCGYNKNTGDVKDSQEFIDVGNGCRLRKDRIECGYVEGPFDGIRRPPHQNKSELRHRPTRTPSNENVKAEKVKEPKVKDSKDSVNPKMAITLTEQPPVTTVLIEIARENKVLSSTVGASPPTSSSTTVKSPDIVTAATTKSRCYYNLCSKLSNPTNPPTVTQGSLIINTILRANPEITTATDNMLKSSKPDASNEKPTTICVEKQDRIVCYDIANIKSIKKNITST